MKKYFHSEKFLYFVASAVFLLTAGLLIFSDFEVIRNVSDKSAFGRVRPIGQDVRLRGDNETDWSSLKREATVYRDDRVFTGAKSSAQVTLKNKQKFIVEPNSLIKITDESDHTVLNMQVGSFFAELKQGARFFVKSKEGTAEIKSNGALVRIESNQNKLKLVVLRGEATASSGGEKNTIVKANEEADIEYRNVRVTPFQIDLKTPSAGGIEWSTGKPVRFSWQTSEQKTVRFEVATDPGFENIVTSKNLIDKQIDVPLTVGQVYFWRVAEEGDRKDRSPTSSFSLYALQAPVLHQEVIENKGELEFSWQDPSFTDSYEVQTSSDPDFSIVQQTIVTEETRATLPRPPAGAYYWRVVSRHSSRAEIFSTVNPLEVKPTEAELAARKLAEAPPPLGTPSLNEVEFKFELVEKLPSDQIGSYGFIIADLPRLSFKRAEEADSHQIELSYTEDFKESFLTSSLPEEKDQWVWTKPTVGEFFVRLKAVRNQEVTYSSVSKMRIIVTAPVFAELKLKGKPNKPPTLRAALRAHPFTDTLEVQIADNENFSSASIKKMKEKAFSVVIKEPGVKYIRARSLNADGWPISRYSKLQKVTVAPLVPEEEAIAPLAKKKEEPKEQEKEQTKRKTEKKFKNHFNVWAGLGMNYLRFNQSGNSDLGSGAFAKLSMPTFSVGGKVQFSETQAAEFQYHDWPGELVGPTSTNIDKTAYHLQSMSAEYQHQIVKNDDRRISLLLGYRIEQTPFLAVNSTGNNVLYANELQGGLIGAKINFFDSEKLEYEISMRYYLLTSSKNLNSGTFKTQRGPMLDGAFGLSKSYDNGFRFGLYWLLEYQNFNYTFTKDGSESTGTQNFLNSNIQFRIGYDFFGLTIIPIIPWRRRRKKK